MAPTAAVMLRYPSPGDAVIHGVCPCSERPGVLPRGTRVLAMPWYTESSCPHVCLGTLLCSGGPRAGAVPSPHAQGAGCATLRGQAHHREGTTCRLGLTTGLEQQYWLLFFFIFTAHQSLFLLLQKI